MGALAGRRSDSRVRSLGYRPIGAVYEPVTTGDAIFGSVRILPSGNVVIDGSEADYEAFTSLEGVIFKGR